MYRPTEEDNHNPCIKCDLIYDGKKPMVACDNCQSNWIHIKCAGLSSIPKEDEEYFCEDCMSKHNQKRMSNTHLLKQSPQKPSTANDAKIAELEAFLVEQKKLIELLQQQQRFQINKTGKSEEKSETSFSDCQSDKDDDEDNNLETNRKPSKSTAVASH
jgi:uncharacterized coiled-coil protein SlyX